MMNLRRLAMHQNRVPPDGHAMDIRHGLMTQTHAQNRDPSFEVRNQLWTDTRLFWRAWPGRNNQVRGFHRGGFINGDLVVAHHKHVLCGALVQFPNALHEVVREGIVVVDEKDQGA